MDQEDIQKYVLNTARFSVISTLVQHNDIQTLRIALDIADELVEQKIFTVFVDENSKLCYLSKFIDQLLCQFAQLVIDDYSRDQINSFIIKHLNCISPEYLLAQYHSSLPFNLQIPVFQYPVQNIVESQIVNNQYIQIQKYLINNQDNSCILDKLITKDNLFLIISKLSYFTISKESVNPSTIINSAYKFKTKLDREFNAQKLETLGAIQILKQWQKSEEGQYAIDQYCKGRKLVLQQQQQQHQSNKQQQQIQVQIAPPQEAVNLFSQQNRQQEDDQANSYSTYSKNAEYINLNISDTQANNLHYFLNSCRMNYFQKQQFSNFLVNFEILKMYLNLPLSVIKQNKSQYILNQYNQLIYEAYNYFICSLFSTNIQYQLISDYISQLEGSQQNYKQNILNLKQFETNNDVFKQQNFDICCLNKLAFFGDLNYFELLLMFVQQFDRQYIKNNLIHIDKFRSIYRLLIVQSVFQPNFQFSGDSQDLLKSPIINFGCQNIAKVLYSVNNLQNYAVLLAAELGFRPFVSELLMSLDCQNMSIFEDLSLRSSVYNQMLLILEKLCGQLAIWGNFSQSFKYLHEN